MLPSVLGPVERRWANAGSGLRGPDGRWRVGWGGRGQQAQLKAASCQPVSYWGLITQTPMKKLLEGN